MAFEELDPWHYKFWLSDEILKVYVQKLSFVDLSNAFDSIHSELMEQILLALKLPKEIVAAIMMLYKINRWRHR